MLPPPGLGATDGAPAGLPQGDTESRFGPAYLGLFQQLPFGELIGETLASTNAAFASLPLDFLWSGSNGSTLLKFLDQAVLPSNLRGIPGVDPVMVFDFVRDEGIPLYLVPRGSIAKSLLRAEPGRARRAILNRRYADITSDCEAVLRACTSATLTSEVHFALEAVAAAKGGYPSAAQALASSVLDSMVRRIFQGRRTIVTDHQCNPNGEHLEEMDLSTAYVLTPIWVAWQSYQRDRGDVLPRSYSRHGSAHHVSRQQFSKRNTVQALMLVASLAAWRNGFR